MASMSAKPAWLRSLAATVAWGGVTAVAAVGSWLGMSTVLTGDPSPAAAATVVTPDGDTSPSEKSSNPRSRDDPPAEGSSSPRDEWNGWSSVGDGAYERAFDTDGGTAVVRLLPGEAVFVSASPAEGYTARREWPSEEHLVVTFHAGDSKVTIDTRWRNDQPYADVSET